jgi:aminocarboxymuconate-semialdehyde decarboxylase
MNISDGSIDIHAHFYPEAYLRLLEKHGAEHSAGCDMSNPEGVVIKAGPQLIPPLERRFVDLDLRIEEMNEIGVGVHALSLTIPMVGFAGGQFALQLSEAYNDACVEAHQKYPDRLVGFATLPWHAPDLACQELDRIAGFPGIRGVYSATRVGDKDLSDESFFPIYERLEDRGLPLFLHPVQVVDPERLESHYLKNLLGNPFESAIAASYLIFGGVLDRFKNLNICLPHAGGAFPYLVGRLDHGSRVRPELAHRDQHPFEYLRRFHYDTITHSKEALEYLIGIAGSDRIMMGSDYCFDMGYEHPVEIVTGQTALKDSEKTNILGGNARKLLGLEDAGQS